MRDPRRPQHNRMPNVLRPVTRSRPKLWPAQVVTRSGPECVAAGPAGPACLGAVG